MGYNPNSKRYDKIYKIYKMIEDEILGEKYKDDVLKTKRILLRKNKQISKLNEIIRKEKDKHNQFYKENYKLKEKIIVLNKQLGDLQ